MVTTSCHYEICAGRRKIHGCHSVEIQGLPTLSSMRQRRVFESRLPDAGDAATFWRSCNRLIDVIHGQHDQSGHRAGSAPATRGTREVEMSKDDRRARFSATHAASTDSLASRIFDRTMAVRVLIVLAALVAVYGWRHNHHLGLAVGMLLAARAVALGRPLTIGRYL